MLLARLVYVIFASIGATMHVCKCMLNNGPSHYGDNGMSQLVFCNLSACLLLGFRLGIECD